LWIAEYSLSVFSRAKVSDDRVLCQNQIALKSCCLPAAKPEDSPEPLSAVH
jgi:hypothetical protein